MPATITTGNWQAAQEPIARKSFVIGLGGRELKERKNMYFRVEGSDKLTETYVEHGDIGPTPEFGGELEYEEVVQGYQSTITNKQYAKGMRIDRLLVRTDQLNIINSLPEMLGLSMRRRIASDAASWFNDMFSTAFATRDGLALVSSAHTSNVGGSNQSNRITTAFGPVALSSARNTMRKFLTNKDNVFEAMPNLVFGSLDLEDAIDEVIKSTGQVNTANNTINVHKGKWTGITDRRFSDSNNWCIADKELMKKYQVWQDVDPVEFKQMDDFDGLTAKYRSYTVYGFGSTGWEWILGAEVD